MSKAKQKADAADDTTTLWWRHPLLSDAVITLLSVVLALVIGAVMIVIADDKVQGAVKYFGARPIDTWYYARDAVLDSYSALFAGAFIDFSAPTFRDSVRPFTETLTFAAPLIAAGLAVGLAFKAGLFNIGAEGQILVGATFASLVGFKLDLPMMVHLPLAIIVAIIGGALWGAIPGILKAITGAHEVITTIMLNYVARHLVAFILTTQLFLRPGELNPKSPPVAQTAEYPLLLGDWSRLHLGFVLSLIAAGIVWWLLKHTSIGFKLRAVGENPHAAKTAGMSVSVGMIAAMAISGALAGFAGSSQLLGTERSLTEYISSSVGFDGITVALLGRGNPLGIVLAGLLFGALRAGGFTMQARTSTPIDLILVLQALIVLFIAAPPLVRAIFRIRAQGKGGLTVSKGWGA